MSERTTAAHGSWKSPITSDLIVSDSIGLDQIVLDGNETYWVENRPSEGGRSVVVRRTANGAEEDVLPAGYNARTRVHEYGGGAYTVHRGEVYFSNFADNHIYQTTVGETPRKITTESGMRYADLTVDAHYNRLICVREDHTCAGHEAVNTIVAVSLETDHHEQVLVSGNDFYSNPMVSPDGQRITWLTWHHPNLPWDGTELWVAELGEHGEPRQPVKVAGGRHESIFQPQWSPDGVLYFVSDKTGWWNLYRWNEGQTEHVISRDAEFGVPQWVFHMSTYGFASADQIVCVFTENGSWNLATVDTQARQLERIDTLFTYIDGIRVQGNRVVFRAGSATTFVAITELHLQTLETQVIRTSSDLQVDEGYLSVPKAIEFPTENGLTAHGIYYPPRNKDYEGPSGERPPLLVHSHGGPTGSYSTTLNLSTQYWTSRGFAVLDVNYGGSTGYGRPYRDRLKGNWGVIDVDDCANGAKYLVSEGEVDGERLAIAGGSAGGYTTLCALTFRDTFKAGASHFGISDLEVFVGDTHKFESRYLDSLIGPYPEMKDVYHERSAIHFTEQLSCPIIFFQGLDDKVVPPNQAELMVNALREKGLPVAYLPFEGEGHGFRKAEHIKRALDAEFYFYGRMFGFTPADDIEPVQIENEK